MACGCDTQTVLEMLFDIDTDNGNNNDRICDESNRDSRCSIVARKKLRVHFSIYVRSTKC